MDEGRLLRRCFSGRRSGMAAATCASETDVAVPLQDRPHRSIGVAPSESTLFSHRLAPRTSHHSSSIVGNNAAALQDFCSFAPPLLLPTPPLAPMAHLVKHQHDPLDLRARYSLVTPSAKSWNWRSVAIEETVGHICASIGLLLAYSDIVSDCLGAGTSATAGSEG